MHNVIIHKTPHGNLMEEIIVASDSQSERLPFLLGPDQTRNIEEFLKSHIPVDKLAHAKKILQGPEDFSILEKNMPMVKIDVSPLLSALQKATNAMQKFSSAAQGKKPRRRIIIKRIKR